MAQTWLTRPPALDTMLLPLGLLLSSLRDATKPPKRSAYPVPMTSPE
jgi:hypothetical protein